VVVIGLLTDRKLAGFQRMPHMTYDERKFVLENIGGVREGWSNSHWTNRNCCVFSNAHASRSELPSTARKGVKKGSNLTIDTVFC
jgi:hypothetical protein